MSRLIDLDATTFVCLDCDAEMLIVKYKDGIVELECKFCGTEVGNVKENE